MAFINKHDTNGTKGLLAKGELGYDDYPTGGDAGRVYVGNGSINIPQAKKSEVIAVDGKIDTHVVRVDNPHAVTKAQVGLGNVQDVDTTNASNITSGTLANARLANSGVTAGTYKSVTVDGKGIVTGGTNPTTLSGYGITDTYTKTETNTQISTAVNGLVDSSPGTLDTLNELAAALGDDPNFATTVTNNIATKVTKNADITAGTNTKITYDTKGLVTGGSTPTTLAGYSIADAYTKTESDAALALKVEKVTSTDNAIVRFNGNTGAVQNSGVSINDAGNLNIGGVANYNSEVNIDSTSVKEYAGISIVNSKYTNSTSYIDAGKSTGISDSSIYFIHNTDNSSNITFQTQDSGNNTDRRVERFRIGANGDIGIGKISGGTKVAIKQRVNSSIGGISIENAAGTAAAVISMLDTGQLILRNAAIDTLSIVNGNTLHISPFGAIGYGTGSGGTVIQATSKSTAVTLNKPSGSITMNNAALAAGAYVGFAINNSILSLTDGILITHSDNGLYLGANYDIKVVYIANGLFLVTVKNISTVSLSDAVTFRFDIIKGANS